MIEYIKNIDKGFTTRQKIFLMGVRIYGALVIGAFAYWWFFV